MRHTPSVESLCTELNSTLPHLDFIVHNACQTVRRPSNFYRHLWKRERMVRFSANLCFERNHAHLFLQALELFRPEEQLALASCKGVVDPVLLSQIELLDEDKNADSDALFPAEVYDVDQQQVDKRAVNSWRLELADVSSTEVIETHLCNSVAPFVINGRLKNLMAKGNHRLDRHIVNVSAMVKKKFGGKKKKQQ